MRGGAWDISPMMFIDQDPPAFLGLQKEKDRKTKQKTITRISTKDYEELRTKGKGINK